MNKQMPWAIGMALILFTSSAKCQSFQVNWSYQTSDKVLASPVSDGETIFIGGVNGIMYALNPDNGDLRWQYDTDGIIQAQALLFDNRVFFESANVFYALDTSTGQLMWKFDTGMEPLGFEYKGEKFQYRIDFWDDKRSTAVLSDGLIYIGAGNGIVYALDKESGKEIDSYQSDNSSPIRSTPMIDGNTLFFGDWDGVVYAYKIESGQLKWKKKTYRYERPYPSFGGIVSSFVRYNDLLIFGARNHMMNVLFAETGEKEWTYIDPKGGWLVGDPVVYKDTLYIGGSDNFSMYAFSPKWGRYLWQHNGGKNIYTRPIVTEDHVIYTAGNGYDWKDTGVLFLLNRMDGKELGRFETPNGIFSSPIQLNEDIFFGCHDGKIYSLSISE